MLTMMQMGLADAIPYHAGQRPDAIAVTDRDRSITYAQLNRAQAAIRERLAGAGVGPGARVGIAMSRDWRLVAAIVAVLRHGCTYVPLDPGYPEERLAFIAADSGVSVVCVSEGEQRPALSDVTYVTIGQETDGTPEPPAGPRPPDLPAYIIYTSGSTGRPKGVAVAEDAVLTLLRSAARHFTFGADDTWTLFHSYSFDFSVWEIWGALVHGGRLVVVPAELPRDPDKFLDLLARERVTVLNQVPSAFRYVVRAYEWRPRDLALRYVIFGGEALDPLSVERWRRLRPGREELVNMYGITEITVHATHAVIGPDDLRDAAGPTRIGLPLEHFGVRVVRPDGTPAETGESGELYLSGPSLALGYVNRPDLTEERFPVSEGVRWYRSGDLVRRGADGQLWYLGRLDSQVNLRGYRIEPGEIEATLRRSPLVADAAVTTHRVAGGEDMLTAHVVLSSETTADVLATLREHCAAELPPHLVPGPIVVESALPLTPSGKLDRSRLAWPAPPAQGQP